MVTMNNRFRTLLVVLPILVTGAVTGGTRVASAEPTVTDLRVGVHEAKTRLVVDLDAAVDFQVFTLADPYRIVIDLPEVEFALPRSARHRTGAIEGYRFGLFEPGTSRIVIDASAPLAVAAAFPLPPSGPYGHRLVLDLATVDRTSFLNQSATSVAKWQSSRRAVKTEKAQVAAATIPPGPASISPGASPGASPTTPASPRLVNPSVPSVVPLPKPRGGLIRPLIAIDPGHGGVDPGAIGGTGVYEKDIVLAAARELARRLERGGRYRVVLTREDDSFVRLRRRIAIAREAGADLFISLHADSIDDRSHRGASVYTLSETASDSEAEALARDANKSDVIAGIDLATEAPDVASILIDLAQRETMNHSARFAELLVDDLRRSVRTLRKGHRFAGFAVLKAPDVPSVLIEMGYLSNSEDEHLLTSSKRRAPVIDAIARGIDQYFEVVRSASR